MLAVALLALVLTPALGAGAKQPPVELWEEYPLHGAPPEPAVTQPVVPAPLEPPTRAPPPPPTPTPESDGQDDTGMPVLPFVLSLVGLALVPLVFAGASRALGRFRRHPDTPQEGATAMSKFKLRREPHEATPDDAEIALMDMTPYSLVERRNEMDEHDQGHPPEAAGPEDARDTQLASPEMPRSFGEVGSHVASVLQAAQESADRIVAGARERAAGLVESAGAEVRQRLADARAEEERISSEVARIRGEAEEYATSRREQVDQELQTLRSNAEREARALREAGEQLRDRLEREALQRQTQLRELEADVEERLRGAWATAREVGMRIGDLLGSAEPDAKAEERPGRKDETLVS